MGICTSTNIRVKEKQQKFSKHNPPVEVVTEASKPLGQRQMTRSSTSKSNFKIRDRSPLNETKETQMKSRQVESQSEKGKGGSDRALPRVSTASLKGGMIDVNKYLEMIDQIDRQKKKKKTV